MAKTTIKPTADQIRKTYISYLQMKRIRQPEAFVEILNTFICQFYDATFDGILSQLDHNYYDRVRDKMAIDREMTALDKKNRLIYSFSLKMYSQFLQSKEFKNLYKRKINIEGNGKRTKATVPEAPKYREETEGERKHILKERDVICRNPRLRQQCLNRYGYQCQCCGMDFAEMYGDKLGANFIEVHHLKPISTFEIEGIPKDFVENLVPLCSNCHSMIHHIEESKHPLRDLREAYRGIKKKLRILKED